MVGVTSEVTGAGAGSSCGVCAVWEYDSPHPYPVTCYPHRLSLLHQRTLWGPVHSLPLLPTFWTLVPDIFNTYVDKHPTMQPTVPGRLASGDLYLFSNQPLSTWNMTSLGNCLMRHSYLIPFQPHLHGSCLWNLPDLQAADAAISLILPVPLECLSGMFRPDPNLIIWVLFMLLLSIYYNLILLLLCPSKFQSYVKYWKSSFFNLNGRIPQCC